jgi:hypothetical protein
MEAAFPFCLTAQFPGTVILFGLPPRFKVRVFDLPNPRRRVGPRPIHAQDDCMFVLMNRHWNDDMTELAGTGPKATRWM